MIALRAGLAILAAGIALAGCSPRNSEGCIDQQIKACMATIAKSTTDRAPDETAIDLEKVMNPTRDGDVVGSGKLSYSVRFNDARDEEITIHLDASTKTGLVSAVYATVVYETEASLSKDDFNAVYRHRVVRLVTGGDCGTQDKAGVDHLFDTVVKPVEQVQADKTGKYGGTGAIQIPFCGHYLLYMHAWGHTKPYMTEQNPTGAYDVHMVWMRR